MTFSGVATLDVAFPSVSTLTVVFSSVATLIPLLTDAKETKQINFSHSLSLSLMHPMSDLTYPPMLARSLNLFFHLRTSLQSSTTSDFKPTIAGVAASVSSM